MGTYTGNAEDTGIEVRSDTTALSGDEARTGNKADLGSVAGKGNVVDCKNGPETDNGVESGRVAGTDNGSEIGKGSSPGKVASEIVNLAIEFFSNDVAVSPVAVFSPKIVCGRLASELLHATFRPLL